VQIVFTALLNAILYHYIIIIGTTLYSKSAECRFYTNVFLWKPNCLTGLHIFSLQQLVWPKTRSIYQIWVTQSLWLSSLIDSLLSMASYSLNTNTAHSFISILLSKSLNSSVWHIIMWKWLALQQVKDFVSYADCFFIIFRYRLSSVLWIFYQVTDTVPPHRCTSCNKSIYNTYERINTDVM